MESRQPWVELDPADRKALLIHLIGFRFGDDPEAKLPEIREERRKYADIMAKTGGVQPGDTLLDLGSGCGFGTGRLAELGARVEACDISPAFLDFARYECREHDNIRFHQIAPRDLSPIADHSIDKVVSMSVFIHLNLYDMDSYFREFRRVLKPGGRAILDFADADRLFRWPRLANDDQFRESAENYRKDPGSLGAMVQFNSARGIRNVAKDAGLRFVKRRGHKLVFRTPA